MTDQNPPEFDLFPRGPAPDERHRAVSVAGAVVAAILSSLVTVWLMAPADPIECALMQAAGVLE